MVPVSVLLSGMAVLVKWWTFPPLLRVRPRVLLNMTVALLIARRMLTLALLRVRTARLTSERPLSVATTRPQNGMDALTLAPLALLRPSLRLTRDLSALWMTRVASVTTLFARPATPDRGGI